MIAYVAPDRQLHVARVPEGEDRQLTLALADNPLLLWGQPGLARTSWAWPVFSPSGTRIAAFELPDGDDPSGPARVQVLDVDGVRQIQVLELHGRVPLYCSWNKAEDGLLVLCQEDEQLVLGFVSLKQIGELRVLEQGAPLFFAWAEDGRRVYVHASGPAGPRLVLRDTLGRLEDLALPQKPGSYCAPVVVEDRLVHVERAGGGNRLISTDAEGRDTKVLLEFSGLGAIVPVPARRRVVFSAAPAGEGTPYRGATLVDLDDGSLTRLADEDVLAFFWNTGADQLVYAQVDTRDNCIRWRSVRPSENPSPVCTFWPSREMLFYLHFFDQFVVSHPLVSADGRFLVFAGQPISGEGGPASRVQVKDLRDAEAQTVLAPGSFACFAPSDGA